MCRQDVHTLTYTEAEIYHSTMKLVQCIGLNITTEWEPVALFQQVVGKDIHGYTYFLKNNPTQYQIRRNIYTNFSQKNESIDLFIFYYFFNKKDPIAPVTKIENINSGLTNYVLDHKKVNNVYDACKFLAKQIQNYGKQNDIMYPDPTDEIGKLTVYSDGREMDFDFSLTKPINLKTLKKVSQRNV